jgi:hypothetical protein
VSQLALLLSYPVIIVHNVLNGQFWGVLLLHMLVMGAMGVIYRIDKRNLPPDMRVPALSFLPMGLLMPVTYALFTPLALFTLDSGSWETRSKPSTATSEPPAPADGTPSALPPTQSVGGGSTP